jgi:phosphoribosylformylglycinamidine cyclo-ligase
MLADQPGSGSAYKDAGVDIDAKTSAINHIRERAKATLGTQAGPIGHFGGTWLLPSGPDQILVASADGVGTKLKLAFTLGGDAHASVGRDIVNHCVNDILALGARPLFFLDYFATGKLEPDVVTSVVGGVTDACLQNSMALLGGETAEMPGMYKEGEYDLAGFIVGSVTPDRKIDGSTISPGDVVIGFPSTGLHTNGYSLARKVIGLDQGPEQDRALLQQQLPGGTTLADALTAEHRSYLPEISLLLNEGIIHGMAHITGGGVKDNLPRTLPEHCIARLDPQAWVTPPIFDYLVERGDISLDERYRVFNMGVGFVIVVAEKDRDTVLDRYPDARQIGEIVDRTTTDESAVQGLSC